MEAVRYLGSKANELMQWVFSVEMDLPISRTVCKLNSIEASGSECVSQVGEGAGFRKPWLGEGIARLGWGRVWLGSLGSLAGEAGEA